MSVLFALVASPPNPLQPFLSAIPLLVIVGVLAVVKRVLKRPTVKGIIGEAALNWAGLSRLDPSRYKVLKNVFIPSIAGDGMTELDHVVLSAHGIFVIETKNYSGWIFGGEHDHKWTRTGHGKKQQFLNPLKQNRAHVNALAAFLGLPQSVFHSVVFFIGEAEIKTPMPSNVLTSGLMNYIAAEQRMFLTDPQLILARGKLMGHDEGMDKATVRREHVARMSSRSGR